MLLDIEESYQEVKSLENQLELSEKTYESLEVFSKLLDESNVTGSENLVLGSFEAIISPFSYKPLSDPQSGFFSDSISLESSNVLDQIIKFVKDILKAMTVALKKLWNKIFDVTPGLIKRCEKIREKARKVEGSPKEDEFEFKGLRGVHIDGEAPKAKDLEKVFKNVVDYSDSVFNKSSGKVDKILKSLTSNLRQIRVPTKIVKDVDNSGADEDVKNKVEKGRDKTTKESDEESNEDYYSFEDGSNKKTAALEKEAEFYEDLEKVFNDTKDFKFDGLTEEVTDDDSFHSDDSNVTQNKTPILPGGIVFYSIRPTDDIKFSSNLAKRMKDGKAESGEKVDGAGTVEVIKASDIPTIVNLLEDMLKSVNKFRTEFEKRDKAKETAIASVEKVLTEIDRKTKGKNKNAARSAKNLSDAVKVCIELVSQPAGELGKYIVNVSNHTLNWCDRSLAMYGKEEDD